MDLCFTLDEQGLEEEIQAGRVTRDGKGGYDINIEHKTALFLENKLLAFYEKDGELITWNPAKDRDPRIQGNENAGQKPGGGGFRFSPFFHGKGKFFQDVAKTGMVKAIAAAHKQITGGYDKDAYIFEDPRLQKLSGFFRSFIAEYFEDGAENGCPRKLTFMYQLIDIVLFLMKEDIYYRSRFFKMFNELPRAWALDEAEEKNIKIWR
jgi:hypothetical protein